MLYVNDDMTLHDCSDMDDTTAAASCDLIQDYKKSSRRSSGHQGVAMTMTKSRSNANWEMIHKIFYMVFLGKSNIPLLLSSPGPKQLGRVASTDSMSSLVSADGDEVEWKIIAILRTSGTSEI